MMGKLTQERLKELLEYDPKTGVFRWLKLAPNVHNIHVGDIAGWKRNDGYLAIMIAGKGYMAHRLAWLYVYGEWPSGMIDHINGNRDDNRITNVRIAKSGSEQLQNVGLSDRNTSGFPGVHFKKQTGRWGAKISLYGKQHHLGYFGTPEEAAIAYRNAKAKMHTFNPRVRNFDYKKAGVQA